MEDLDEIVHEFLVESHENLDQLDADLLALEEHPGSRELLGSVFRTIHTIKGTSGFLAYAKLERVTHAGENLLVELRDGRRTMDLSTTDVLLQMVDSVRALLTSIEGTGTEGDVDIDPVVARVHAVLDGTHPTAGAAPEAEAAREVQAEPSGEAEPAPEAQPAPEAHAEPAPEPEAVVEVGSTPEVEPAAALARSVEPAGPPPSTRGRGIKARSNRPAPSAVVPTPHAPADPEPAAAPAAPVAPATTREPAHESAGTRSAADGSIRVDVDLLDALMRQVSELVLARNAISRLAGTGDIDLARASQRLSLIASELQEGVMKTRMQPIEHVWSKVPRMVRDLAASCGRQVRLDMVGGDTELDRSLLEAIKDPLTHLVRNAIDHGIESPAQRVAGGKPAQGTLTLRAHHAGGQVLVEVSDNGKGIDHHRVAAKAVERGVRTEQQVAGMGPAELLQLLFLPGFSTADTVTNVSGRGVGMDVVRTKIESIGGTVDVESVVGSGTTWRLRIPLTLAIMPAVTVECAEQVYAIPQVSLLELVALGDQNGDVGLGEAAVEYVGSAPVYRLRGDLLPLVSLREVFGLPPRQQGGRTVIAVLQADTIRFGLVVDRVLNTEEIVVKPLSARLKAIGLYAGATLMGDGRVSLILDVQGLARRSMAGEVMDQARNARRTDVAEAAATVQVLVAGIGDGRRVAIPLSAVTRLEKLPAAVIEHVGGREVMQYRGEITPVVRLDRILGTGSGYTLEEDLTVVVYTRGRRSVAIVVGEIVDIVDDLASRHSDLGDGGLLGSTVLKDRVTELLDVRWAVAAADPSFFDEESAPTGPAGTAPGGDIQGEGGTRRPSHDSDARAGVPATLVGV